MFAREVRIEDHLPGAAVRLSGRIDFVVVTVKPTSTGGHDIELRIVEVKSASAAHIEHMAQVLYPQTGIMPVRSVMLHLRSPENMGWRLAACNF